MSQEQSIDIWVVGSTMIDMITYSKRIPNAGETIVGDRFDLGFGGKGANQAVMARRLGASVGMVDCLGTDVFGDMTIANFAREGIDTTFITRTSEVSSGVAPIWVEPNGTNRIICVPGANFSLTPEEAADAIQRAPRMDLVVGQFEILQETTAGAFRAARERGVPCVLNPAPAAPPNADLLAVTDWLVPNEVEFADIATGILGRLADPFISADIADLAGMLGLRMVVTLGERGAALCHANGDVQYIEPPAVTAVDTTGAGDAFVGAFSYGLASGLGEVQAVRLGCACAASSVTRPGTQASFPRGEDLTRARAWAEPAGEPA
jgi:ribokinase